MEMKMVQVEGEYAEPANVSFDLSQLKNFIYFLEDADSAEVEANFDKVATLPGSDI